MIALTALAVGAGFTLAVLEDGQALGDLPSVAPADADRRRGPWISMPLPGGVQVEWPPR